MSTKPKIIKKSTIEHVKRRFNIIGNDPALNQCIAMALRIAPTRMNVLITGANGSGKESFSKIIHHYSSQKHGKLIAVNCGALPEGTIDSALFGHEKGSFTGATETRKGYFQEANDGTIFLDEIGEMPLETQSRLLRVLEYGEFMKVGSSKVETTKVRIIAATHVDLLEAVAQNTFRQDLYYRLNTISLRIPSLNERGNDIFLLFKKFSADFAQEYGRPPLRLDDEAHKVLMRYNFPGNIRELKNLVLRLSVLEKEAPMITAEKLQKYLPKASTKLPMQLSKQEHLSERELLYKILFDMQRELLSLKKIIFEAFSRDSATHHLLEKHPLLFDRSAAVKHLSPPTIAVLPADNDVLPAPVSPTISPQDSIDITEDGIMPLEEMEKKAIARTLKHFNNNRKKVAKALGIPERTLYRKIKKYGF